MAASTAITALALVAEQVVVGRRRLTFAGRVFEQLGEETTQPILGVGRGV